LTSAFICTGITGITALLKVWNLCHPQWSRK